MQINMNGFFFLFFFEQDRSKVLMNFHNLLMENQEELAAIVSMETVSKHSALWFKCTRD